jgi:glycosyltransferase involved in cell wall biosynthesis
MPVMVLGGGMTDLSVLIPARNEMFLRQTIDNILANIRADTEIIAVLDGAWADPPIEDHERVTLVYYPQSIGQRAATNQAARLAKGKYIMKLDAHCAVAEGFDTVLVEAGNELGRETTQIARMYNLHAFDWLCPACGYRSYQGPNPHKCGCGAELVMDIIWEPRSNTRTDFARFDRDLHFQYWREYKERPESKGDIADVMCSVGACWMMERERYWQLGGLDERHGSWGQMGVEIACKSWLSGGRQVVNKKTWFAHMFRTQGGDFGFPYAMTGDAQEAARKYSRWLWEGNNWDGAVYPFRWLIDKFAPVPEWDKKEWVAPSLQVISG